MSTSLNKTSLDSSHTHRRLHYCGRKVGQDGYQAPCGACDGTCGPNTGCQCKSCYAVDRSEAAEGVLFKDPGTTEKMLTKMVSLENLDLTVASPIEEIRAFTKKLWRLIASPIFQPVPYDETLAVRAAKWDEADEGDDEEEAGGDKTE